MNATTRPLAKLVDLMGARPDPGLSDRRHWYFVVLGAFLFAANALPAAGWASSPGDPYTQWLALCVGLNFASWGASGLLLRRGKEALSLGFSSLRAVLFFPMTAFLFLAVRGWLGLPWAVGVAVAACAIFYVVRSRQSRQNNEGA